MFEITKLFIASFISLFTIVDPICAAPIFVSVTAGDDRGKKNRQARNAAFYMLLILSTFFIGGSLILNFFGISIEGIKIAGGLMMITSAKGMLDEKKKLSKIEHEESIVKDDVAFSPIAMPLLSGPGAIAVTLGLASHAKSFAHYAAVLSSIIVVAFISYLILRFSAKIVGYMSSTMMNAMTKMMGFILLCIGVQFILDGLVTIFNTKIIITH
ncbi:MAG TPA: MarC family protein [Candidatus Wallbacteria bacterium]|nr:MarC family protein [Candidatus Wallbacteria bacterium]